MRISTALMFLGCCLITGHTLEVWAGGGTAGCTTANCCVGHYAAEGTTGPRPDPNSTGCSGNGSICIGTSPCEGTGTTAWSDCICLDGTQGDRCYQAQPESKPKHSYEWGCDIDHDCTCQVEYGNSNGTTSVTDCLTQSNECLY